MKKEYDWLRVQYGLCPNYMAHEFDEKLKIVGDKVVCSMGCGFHMDKDTYITKYGQKKNGQRSWGYHVVKHNSRTEDELMEDLCRVN